MPRTCTLEPVPDGCINSWNPVLEPVLDIHTGLHSNDHLWRPQGGDGHKPTK